VGLCEIINKRMRVFGGLKMTVYEMRLCSCKFSIENFGTKMVRKSRM